MKDVKAIFAGTIYTPSEEIRDGVILVEGHRIARVGPRDQVKVPAGATAIDYQDRTVVPGFIDIHIHGAVGHDLMEATPEDRKSTRLNSSHVSISYAVFCL